MGSFQGVAATIATRQPWAQSDAPESRRSSHRSDSPKCRPERRVRFRKKLIRRLTTETCRWAQNMFSPEMGSAQIADAVRFSAAAQAWRRTDRSIMQLDLPDIGQLPAAMCPAVSAPSLAPVVPNKTIGHAVPMLPVTVVVQTGILVVNRASEARLPERRCLALRSLIETVKMTGFLRPDSRRNDLWRKKILSSDVHVLLGFGHRPLTVVIRLLRDYIHRPRQFAHYSVVLHTITRFLHAFSSADMKYALSTNTLYRSICK